MVRHNVVLKYGLFALAALIPLPFAGKPVWAVALTAMCVGLLVCWDVISQILNWGPQNEKFGRRMLYPALATCAVISWVVIIQTNNFMEMAIHPIWAEASAQLGQRLEGSISVNTSASFDGLMAVLVYAGGFWLAARLGQETQQADHMLRFLMIGFGLYAAYGQVVFFANIDRVLWFEKTAYLEDITSTFINRNNFATYMALGVIVTLSVIFRKFEKLGSRLNRQRGLSVILTYIAIEMWKEWMVLVVILTALLLTHSRAGTASAFIGIGVWTVGWIAISKASKGVKLGGLMSLIVLASFVLFLSGAGLFERVAGADKALLMRTSIYEAVLDGVFVNPIWGYGLGGFEEAFRVHKHPFTGWANWEFAHNTYVEVLFEYGVPIGLLWFALAFWMVRVFVRGMRERRRNKVFPLTGLAAIATITVHSSLDFSIQIPAVAFAFSAIIGVAWAQSYSWHARRHTANSSSTDTFH